MAIQIKSDRKETENKTIRFPVDLISRIEEVMREKMFPLLDLSYKRVSMYWMS